MDKGEPSLVPEWLRSSGHASGGGSSNHLLISSSSHSGGALVMGLLSIRIVVSTSIGVKEIRTAAGTRIG